MNAIKLIHEALEVTGVVTWGLIVAVTLREIQYRIRRRRLAKAEGK